MGGPNSSPSPSSEQSYEGPETITAPVLISRKTRDIKLSLWWPGVGQREARPQNLEEKLGLLILPVGNTYNDQVVVVS